MSYKVRLTANKPIVNNDIHAALSVRPPDLPDDETGWWWKATKNVYVLAGSFLDIGGSDLSDADALAMATYLKAKLEAKQYTVTLEIAPPEAP